MSYLTLKSESISSTQDFLFLDYEREGEKNIITEKGIKTILPKPYGLSGAFIFKVEMFQEKKVSCGYHPLQRLLQSNLVGKQIGLRDVY